MVLRLRTRASNTRSCWPGFLHSLRVALLQAADGESFRFPGDILPTSSFEGTHLVRPQLDWHQRLHPILPYGHSDGQP
jgi:hypothetical protein